MATHEIYLGGPSTGNESRAFFPKRSFSAASGSVFAKMRPAVHKGPSLFFLNRVLDFANDTALRHFIRTQAAEGAPVTTGDVLGALVVPHHVAVYGVAYEVVRPAPTNITFTPTFRNASISQAAIATNVVSRGYAAVGGTPWRTAAASAANNVAYFPNVDILDLTLGTVGADGFGDLRLEIGLVLADLHSGEY